MASTMRPARQRLLQQQAETRTRRMQKFAPLLRIAATARWGPRAAAGALLNQLQYQGSPGADLRPAGQEVTANLHKRQPSTVGAVHTGRQAATVTTQEAITIVKAGWSLTRC